MDFPGDTITNIRVIEGFSHIYWRLYTEEQGLSANLPESQPNGFVVLRHLSRLKELELRLRNLDCLVACLPRRLGLWIFSAAPDFQSLGPLRPPGDRPDSTRLQVDTAVLKVSASGSTTSQDLIRNLSAELPKTQTQSASTAARRPDVFNSSSAIYATFITAVSGAISLQLVRHHDATPLGPRSLFTAIERGGYQSPRIVTENPSSIPSLTTLHVQLTAVGKLVVWLQTIAQAGLSRLGGPRNAASEISDCPPGLDLWLAPTGAVARFFGTDPDKPSASSPSVSSAQGAGYEPSSHVSRLRRKCWKASVLDWIGNYGLTVDSIDEEIWIEVEVCDSFYARLAGDVARHSARSLSVIPLKRIPWPARYCFRRTHSAADAPSELSDQITDPLNLAEQWLSTSAGLPEQLAFKPPLGPQVQTTTADDFSLSSEGLDSLSRITQYPDIQTPGLVYPTPPDGPGAVGFGSTPSEPFNEENGVQQSLQRQTASLRSQNVAHGLLEADQNEDFVASTGMMVGSGVYDANDEEDLFSEIAEKDFGAKGITDADFSFFDVPDFEPIENVSGRDTQGQQRLADKAAPTPMNDTQSSLPNGTHGVTQPTTAEEGVAPPMMATTQSTLDAHLLPLSVPALSPSDKDRGETSPPLDSIEIKRILFPDQFAKPGASHTSDRRQSHYSPVKFSPDVGSWAQKYGAEGKFWFSARGKLSANDQGDSNDDIPIIGLPSRGNKTVSAIVSKPTPVKDGAIRATELQLGGHPGSVSSTDDSDATGEMDTDSDLSPVAPAILKRKRVLSPRDTSPVPGSENATDANPQDITTFKAESATFLGNFLSSVSDWPLTGYFSVSETHNSPVLLRREDQIPVAQLLVDQITQSSLSHTIDGGLSLLNIESDACSPRTFIDEIPLGQIERLDLTSFVSLQDTDASAQTKPGQPSGPYLRSKEVDSVVKIPPPHLRIRRGKDFFEVLPPAISFWETFGLEPPSGPKDVSAYCIHPAGITEAADAFLERLGLLYSSCALGKHDRGEASEAFVRGLASWQVDVQSTAGYASTMQSFGSICKRLGPALSKIPTGKECLLVYVINPWTHATALVDICAAFWELFQKYLAESDQRSEPLNEIALQIVPLSFVASSESIVVPPQEDYLRLALEVYSRCPAPDPMGGSMSAAPPLLLAETLPRTINFRLASDRFSPLQEGKCLHLAYSRSKDQRWLSAAWTDNVGLFQRSASYCLRFRGSVASRPTADARNEIWETTRSILEKVQVRWRLIVAMTDYVDQDEIDAWATLVDQFNRARHLALELTIISVNPTPDLHLEAPSLPVPRGIFNSQVASPPATTPNLTASAFSPDPVGSAPTPTSWGNMPASVLTPTEAPFDAESESLLVDITDESWAVVLSHRLNISPRLTEYRPALVSGYLLRRKSASDGDGAYSMSVNLIYSQRSPSAQEALLRDLLGMYRDLATLARSKGMIIAQHNTLPWHIATAVRAQEILTYSL